MYPTFRLQKYYLPVRLKFHIEQFAIVPKKITVVTYKLCSSKEKEDNYDAGLFWCKLYTIIVFRCFIWTSGVWYGRRF